MSHGCEIMALNPGLHSSLTSPKRSQRWYDIAKSFEDSQSRVYCRQIVGCGVVPMVLRNRCQSSVVADNSRVLSHGYIDGTLLRKENVNTGMTCYAQIDSEPWNDEASFVELSYLSQTDSEKSGRLASAVGLIMGTAVGPGILGLPAATLHAGLIPSTVTIVVVWAYVMASILLVAELSYAVMAEQGVAEVSFTGLAVRTLGHSAGRVVALVYAFLNYALLVACVAGLHSILVHWLPLHPALVCILSPGVVAFMLAFTSFQAVDILNRALCGLMIASITGLIGIGVSVGRDFWLGSIGSGTWSFTALSPAIPVIVLTLGFHVITPVVCQVVGGRPQEARKAILCGGAVPLSMVLAWNAVIVGLAQSRAESAAVASFDPIKLLLSLSSTAAPVVQAFAFAALGTTLIGYALSFPRQLIDTVNLFGIHPHAEESLMITEEEPSHSRKMTALLLAMAPPVAVAMTSPTAFASALDFAGLYANCFLFGVLPPIMAWVYRYQQPRSDQERHPELLPGGRILLMVLLLIAVYLGFNPPNART